MDNGPSTDGSLYTGAFLMVQSSLSTISLIVFYLFGVASKSLLSQAVLTLHGYSGLWQHVPGCSVFKNFDFSFKIY